MDKSPTYVQRSMWLSNKINPADSSYNIAFVARVLGNLDRDILQQVCLSISDKHDALRMTFSEKSGTPYSTFNKVKVPAFVFFDLSDEREEAIHNRILAYHKKPFDLTDGPLVRWGLFRTSEEEHILLLTMFHSVGDFRSLEIIIDELGKLYHETVSGLLPKNSNTSPKDFEAFVVEEDAFLCGARSSASEEYWKENLKNPPSSLCWPGPDGVKLENECASYFFEISSHVTDALRQRALDERTSLHSILLAAWSVTVSSFTSEDDVIFGIPTSTRSPAFKDVVGCFINTLPIRLRVDRSFTFGLYASEVQKVMFNGLSHRQYPFPLIVEKTASEREAGRNPLFQTMFSLQRSVGIKDFTSLFFSENQETIVPWGALQLAPWLMPQQEGQVDLMLEIVESDRMLRAVLKNRAEIVPTNELPIIAKRYTFFLEQIIENYHRQIDHFLFASESECWELIQGLNPQKLLPTPTESLIDRISVAVQSYSDSIAISDGTVTMTYAELYKRATEIAVHLLSAGARPGERVGVALPASIGAVEAMAGILYAGMSYCPIDLRNPPARTARIIGNSSIRFVLASTAHNHELPDTVCRIDLESIQAASQLDISALESPTSTALAYTVFTSGSTGEPKGIDVRHGGVVAMIDATASVLNADHKDVWVWFHAATFDLSVWEIWGALCSGGRVVVAREDIRARPDLFAELIAKEKVTLLLQTPTALRILAEEFDDIDTKALKHVMSCGEALPGPTARKYLGHNFDLWNLYGPAEATVFATALFVDEIAASYESVPIGDALRHSIIYLMDETLRPVAKNQVGELCIAGLGLAKGYVGMQGETERRFVRQSLFGEEVLLYRTGDFAFWDGQHLRFCGRRDGQIKVRGYRVELGDIEAALMESPIIADAVALVSEEAVVAAVELIKGSTATESNVRSYLETKLPSYMMPSRIVALQNIPVNAHGKHDRPKIMSMIHSNECCFLKEQYMEDIATEGDLERAICNIWSSVLKRPNVALNEQFFQMGGNSLQLIQVLTVIREGICEDLRPADMFQYPTIRKLAQRIQNLQEGTNEAMTGTRGKIRQQLEGINNTAQQRMRIRSKQDAS